MDFARRILAVLAAGLGLGAHAGQYSDMWWNPQESGWGINVVQQLETAFVTLYVYGPDGKPTWYVGPNVAVYAYSLPGGFPQFQGSLYRTTGPYHGGAFDPAAVTVTNVGTIDLEVLARNRIRVSYTADGVKVTREVQRQTWAMPILAMNYEATFSLRQVVNNQALGTLIFTGEMLAFFDADAFVRVVDNLGRKCEYRGPYQQAGKLISATGNFTCVPAGVSTEPPTSGTFELTDLEVTEHGMTGYLRTFSPTLGQYGRFAALRF